MSIKLLDRSWRYSTAKGGDLLVLLAIADFANDDGVAYPSIATLATKARLTPRNTQRAIRHLVTSGDLVLEEGKGLHGTHLYRIALVEGIAPTGCQNVRVTKSQDDKRDMGGVTFQPPNPLKRTVIKKDIPVDDKKSPSRPPEDTRVSDSASAVDSLFEQFWTLYPTRDGKKPEKRAACKNFSRLTADDRHLVIVAVKHYAASDQWPKDPHRWLRTGKGDEPWRDWIEVKPSTKKPTNGHGSHPTCTKRIPGPNNRLLFCGHPASPDSRPSEPRCAAHFTSQQTQLVAHATH